MSLESGVMLWRLNQELLPEPGRPTARITAPLGVPCGREGAAGAGNAADESSPATAGWGLELRRPRRPRPRRRRGRWAPPEVCAPEEDSLAGIDIDEDESVSAATRRTSGVGSEVALAAGGSGGGAVSQKAGCRGAGSAAFSSGVFLR